jgi:hypothetical protein
MNCVLEEQPTVHDFAMGCEWSASCDDPFTPGIICEAEWKSKPFWALWNREKSLPMPGIESRPPSSLLYGFNYPACRDSKPYIYVWTILVVMRLSDKRLLPHYSSAFFEEFIEKFRGYIRRHWAATVRSMFPESLLQTELVSAMCGWAQNAAEISALKYTCSSYEYID